MGHLLSPPPHDRDPIRHAELLDGFGQEVGAPLVRIEQAPGRRGPRQDQHEPGKAAAAPQVERSSRPGPGEGGGEPASVLDVGFDRPRTQEPEVTGPLEDSDERLVGALRRRRALLVESVVMQGDQSTGRITTRRR